MPQQLPWRAAHGQTHAELTGPRAHRKRQHAADAHDRDEQGDAGESREHERVEPFRREHLGTDVFERRGTFHGLLGGYLADDARHGSYERVGIPRGTDEQAARNAHLPNRHIDRHGRRLHHVLVIDVSHDADDAAGLRLARARAAEPEMSVQGIAAGEQPLGDALADDRHEVAAATARVREVATGEERDSEHVEEPR